MLSGCGGTVTILVDATGDAISEVRDRVINYIVKGGFRKIILVAHREGDIRPLEALRESILSNHVYSLIVYEARSRSEALKLVKERLCRDHVVVVTTRSGLDTVVNELGGRVVTEVIG